MGTVKKNDQDWRRYYLHDPIIDKPMRKLTVQELKDWAHKKIDAGERDVSCTTYAKRIVQMIREASERYGHYDEGYIFCPHSRRIAANSIDKKLYNYCNAVGVDKKSAHKIRKTFISRLIRGGQIDIDTDCRMAKRKAPKH